MTTDVTENNPQPTQYSEPSSFGLNSTPPMSTSQVATNQQQAQLITKHKRVFAVDPESSYPTDQLSSSMGQMNLGTWNCTTSLGVVQSPIPKPWNRLICYTMIRSDIVHSSVLCFPKLRIINLYCVCGF